MHRNLLLGNSTPTGFILERRFITKLVTIIVKLFLFLCSQLST